MRHLPLLLSLTALASATLFSDGEALEDKALAAQSSGAPRVGVKSSAKFIFPSIQSSTITVFMVTSVTSTVPVTCFSTLTGSATACTGRKRRRRRRSAVRLEPLDGPSGVPELESSVRESSRDTTPHAQASRLVLTSWISVISTFTSVSTVTTFGTTVKLDLLCSIGGTNYFSLCGGK